MNFKLNTILTTPFGTFAVSNHITTVREALMYMFGIDPETLGNDPPAIEAAVREQMRLQKEYERTFDEKPPNRWRIIDVDANRKIALVKTDSNSVPINAINLVTKIYIFDIPGEMKSIPEVLYGIFGPLEGREVNFMHVEEALKNQYSSPPWLPWAYRCDESVRFSLRNYFLLDERPEFKVALAVNPEGNRVFIVRNEIIQVREARTVPEAFEEAFGIDREEARDPEKIKAILAFLAIGS